MRVTVLYGGPSAEREVSLVSGRAVIDGLKSMGHEVFASDVSPADLSGLDHSCDVVFPVLHGEFGESGELQEILEQPNRIESCTTLVELAITAEVSDAEHSDEIFAIAVALICELGNMVRQFQGHDVDGDLRCGVPHAR